MLTESSYLFLMVVVGLCSGVINSLAGGGPIIVVATLAAFGLPATTASLTSTVSLLPGQVAAVLLGRSRATPLPSLASWRGAVALALAGGAVGATLLLLTPVAIFARLLPYLIILATVLYGWQSRSPVASSGEQPPRRIGLLWWLVPLSIYGGFYGGGNSFMVMALLAAYGLDLHAAAHAKNRIILLINLAAGAIFFWSGAIAWPITWPLAIGATLGSLAGIFLLGRVNPRQLRWIVIAIGGGLAGFLLLRGQ